MTIKVDLLSWLRGRKHQAFKLGKVISVSMLNQMVSSGTNFLLGLYLVRTLTPAEFGLYGIGFSISLFYAGVGNALFLTQMVVHVPDKVPGERLLYAARMLTAVVIFCLLSVFFAGLLIELAGVWWKWFTQHVGWGIAVTAASVTYLLKDFFVRHAYTAQKETWALGTNMVVAFVLMGLLVVHYFFIQKLNSEIALWLYAASNMGGAAAALSLVRLPLPAVRLRPLIEDVREAWVGGRWALGGTALSWMQSQAYVYLTALFVGSSGVGQARAARLLITPAVLLLPALGQLAMPRLAEMGVSNPRKMLRVGVLFIIGLLILAIIYSATLLSLVDIFVSVLFGPQYGQITPLVIAWCLVLFFQFARTGNSIILQVVKDFRSLTLVIAVGSIVTVVASMALMKLLGVHGVVLGVAAGDAIMAAILFRLVWTKFTEFH